MESDAVRSLAARVPPELFDDILFYVNADRVSQRNYEWGNYLIRNGGTPSPDDILTDLKRCSLVCLFWANRCREHMFSKGILWIRSYEDAEIFRRYFARGCSRLAPVHQLIRQMTVIQDYSGEGASQGSWQQASFLHLLYLPAIQDKLDQLFIYGPVPEGFSPAKLDTPHWGIPPCIVAPSLFLQKNVCLRHIHLPSFHHVTKYIRHFSCATRVSFGEITWDGQMDLSLPRASSTLTCQRRPRSLTIWTKGVCTDSVYLASTALMLNPNCPLHRLSDEERVWMIRFMTLRWGHKPDPRVSIEFDVSEEMTTMELDPFNFVFEETSAPTDRSASGLSVVGMHAYIHNSLDFPADFDALVNHARTHPTIRALVLLFRSIGYLQESVKPFIQVHAPAADTTELVLAYEKDERRVVSVDPDTLEPNDCLWADLQGRYGGDKSWEMLQRQLKKKRWMSVH